MLISLEDVTLEGAVAIPSGAQGVVIFAHGSGSSRHSPRNNFVAKVLRKEGLATLLLDLLTGEEDQNYETRFNIHLLTTRLMGATQWLADYLKPKRPAPSRSRSREYATGYFGASTGAAAALDAAAKLGTKIGAVVSRGGRPDLARESLPHVKAPTLLIVGGDDLPVIGFNRMAFDLLKGEKELVMIPGATHLFEEPGTLEKAAELAAEWFRRYLKPAGR